MIIEFNLDDHSGNSLHSLSNVCFKGVTVKHVTPARTSLINYFDRTKWMESNCPVYGPFDLVDERKGSGPTYLQAVLLRHPQYKLDDPEMDGGGTHQQYSAFRKTEHYASVVKGELSCYVCEMPIEIGWHVCWRCQSKTPLTETAAEDMMLAALTDEERLKYKMLLTGNREIAERQKTKMSNRRGTVNTVRHKFELTAAERARAFDEAQAQARKANYERQGPYREVEQRAVNSGPIWSQLACLMDGPVASVAQEADIGRKYTVADLCARAGDILRLGFKSHEDCYWGDGAYRIKCDVSGGKSECIGPKFHVYVVDAVKPCLGAIYTFDSIATNFNRFPFPDYLYQIRDAAKNKQGVSKGADPVEDGDEAGGGSTSMAPKRLRDPASGPGDAGSSRDSPQAVAVDPSVAPSSMRGKYKSARHYLDSTERVRETDQIEVVRAELAPGRPKIAKRAPPPVPPMAKPPVPLPPPAKPMPPAKRTLSPSGDASGGSPKAAATGGTVEGATATVGLPRYRDVRLSVPQELAQALQRPQNSNYPSGGRPQAAAACGSDSRQDLWANYSGNFSRPSSSWQAPAAKRNDQWHNSTSNQQNPKANASRDRGWGSSWGSKWDRSNKW